MKRRRNPSDSNPYGIDDRVWERIVGSETPTLSRIMFAAALDPLMLVDLDMIQPPRSLDECVQLADMGTRGDLRNYLRGVLISWAMSYGTPSSAASMIASFDPRLGLWCAIACVEKIVSEIPMGYMRDSVNQSIELSRLAVFEETDMPSLRAASQTAARLADRELQLNEIGEYSHQQRLASVSANLADAGFNYLYYANFMRGEYSHDEYLRSQAMERFVELCFSIAYRSQYALSLWRSATVGAMPSINRATDIIRMAIVKAIEAYPLD